MSSRRPKGNISDSVNTLVMFAYFERSLQGIKSKFGDVLNLNMSGLGASTLQYVQAGTLNAGR